MKSPSQWSPSKIKPSRQEASCLPLLNRIVLFSISHLYTHMKLLQSCLTEARKAPLSMRFSRQEHWSGLLHPPPGDLPNPGSNPHLLGVLQWQVGSLPLVKPGKPHFSLQFSSVQSLSRVWLFVTPWTATPQASLSITSSRSLLKLMSIELVMPSSHLILCRPLLRLPPIPPSIRVFSSESTLRMRRPKYWSFSFSISPSNEHPGLISSRMDWLDLLAVQGTLKSHFSLSTYQILSSCYLCTCFLLPYPK